jgi:hypothetical protein
MQETQEKSNAQMTRLAAFCKAFGWQGGTIHQVEEITGCCVVALTGVESQTADPKYHDGFVVAKSNQVKEALATGVFKGRLQFWLGVAGFFIAQETFKDVSGSFAAEPAKQTGPFKKCLLKSKAPGNKTFQFQAGQSVTRSRIKATPFTFKSQEDFDGFMAEIKADNPGWEFEAVDLPV